MHHLLYRLACNSKRYSVHSWNKLLSYNDSACREHRRLLCASDSAQSFVLLQDEPQVFSTTIGNTILALITSVYHHFVTDRGFNIADFSRGSRKVLDVIAQTLFNQDVDQLKGLIHDKLIDKLRARLPHLTEREKQMLDLRSDDILSAFVASAKYSQQSTEKQFFEVLTVFHCFYKLSEYRDEFSKETVIGSLTDLEKTLERIRQNQWRCVIVNLRLSKQVSPSLDQDWTVSSLNFFSAPKNLIMPSILNK